MKPIPSSSPVPQPADPGAVAGTSASTTTTVSAVRGHSTSSPPPYPL